MAAPSYSIEDFRQAVLSILPTGPIWPRDPDSLVYQAAEILAAPYARNVDRANDLLIDAFPATASELLPDWESTLGLPDPCAGVEPTLQQRRAQVVARLTDAGGSSIAYLVGYAATLGYAITISQFAPARAGMLRAGQPARGAGWAFAWQVNASSTTVTYFRAGVSAAGEPLAAFGNAVLQCELGRIAPAHTTPIFAYGS